MKCAATRNQLSLIRRRQMVEIARMNGTPAKVEIFAPFGAAIELMQKILFRPFDITKWLVIGFAAFLSHLAGGGANFNWNSRLGNWRTQMHSATRDAADSFGSNAPLWAVPIGIFVVLLIIAVIAVFLWLGSRGRFIFTDCIVRNRGAIAEPWHEYRHEANSLFVFSLVIALICLAIVIGAGIVFFLPALLHDHGAGAGVPVVFGGVLFVLVLVLIAVGWALISQFMVPVMYRRRCTAPEAFRITTALIGENLGVFLLYLLFLIVLGIAAAMIACLATCVTCCIAAIPYVGTVILLPVYVTLGAYPLLFLRQFGPDYDVWGGVPAVESAEPPMQTRPGESVSPPPPEPPPPPVLPT